MDEMRILSCTLWGFGLPESSLKAGLKLDPDVIVAQGTSSDIGPYYLGSGSVYPGEIGFRRDMTMLISAAREKEIPFIISVGGAGADVHVDWAVRVLRSAAKEKGLKFRAALLSGEVSKEYIERKLSAGEKMKRLVETPRLVEFLSTSEVDRAERIVSQMGPEPIMQALDLDVDGIITGRALDVGLHMAPLLKNGFDKGLAAHMGKIIECGAMATDPTGIDFVMGIMKKDHFLVKATAADKKCTVVSVAAHSFYERPDPSLELNPGGILDISKAKYEQVDDSTVKVSGSRWLASKYAVKLEGAAKVGYRSVSIGGIRDPILIANIDDILNDVKETLGNTFRNLRKTDYALNFLVYGKNAVMGRSEPETTAKTHELCIVIDVVAQSQQMADGICGSAEGLLLHYGGKGIMATAGNLAFPFSPSHISMGSVYVFNIWHLMEVEDPCEPFRTEIVNFPGN